MGGGQSDSTIQLQPGVPCRGGLVNEDGRLICRAPKVPAPAGAAVSASPALPPQAAESGVAMVKTPGLPVGTYSESCEGCSLQGHGASVQLHCVRCLSSDGRKRSSSLMLAGCSSVQNSNGRLACAQLGHDLKGTD